ncbi:MAG: molecular chaperone DnaJ [Candidatus Xiphinematobacter sp.]|nr:MAG: molecular chaperone DnaJ [Candidatus Xiphinematobacter sp.]QQY09755.1 MAG: molecular chaperone DnaJ [Candidatus Xiphinematobacter sp.]QQY10498.1 MAG: molecular chaperone DnaJ [Candidatus Xiphinematobacter sp.]QQY11234.1 MAG: molecular chaperone DnaJ [Candidatus Xiphinematobacter sp.]
MREKKGYYEILGISQDADANAIKRAYRKLAVKFHPDKNPGNKEAEERFKEVSEAYDVLMDPERRTAYDRYGHAAFQQEASFQGRSGGFHDPFDIFREVFGGSEEGGGIFEQFFGGRGGRGEEGRQRGSDLRYDMKISLEEAARGCEKEIEIRKLDVCECCGGLGAQAGSRDIACSMCRGRGQVVASRGFFQISQTCPTCQGSGRVIEKPCRPCSGEGRVEKSSRMKLKVPIGIEDGSRLRSSGRGEAGIRGGAPGDLYVIVHIRQHRMFQRDGSDLYCEIPIPFATAALGGEVRVPTLENTATLKIPPGTQNGTLFRISSRGMPLLRSSGHGNLHVKVQVEVPTSLNSEQRRKLEEFAELCGEHNMPLHRSFYEKLKGLFS